MAFTPRKLAQAFGLLLISALGATASARDTGYLDRVEVRTGATLRHDVQRSCPAVQAELQQALNRRVTKHQIEGSFPVLFEIKDSQVVAVRTPRVPLEYGFALRRAVKGLDCQDSASHQQPQRFGFMLDIKMDDADAPLRSAGEGGQRLAMALRPL